MYHGGFHTQADAGGAGGVGTGELVGFQVCYSAQLAAVCSVIAERAAQRWSPRAAEGGTLVWQSFGGRGCGDAFANSFVRTPVKLLTCTAAVDYLVAAAAALGAWGGAGGVAAGLGHFWGGGCRRVANARSWVVWMCDFWGV